MTTPDTPGPTGREPETGADIVPLDAARAARPALPGPGPDDDPAPGAVLDGEVVRVDQPGGHDGHDWLATLAGPAAPRHPVTPPWLRSRQEAAAVARWVSAHYLHVTGYHAVRLPKYGGKLAARSPRGLARLAGGLVRWMFDLEGHPVRM